MKIEDVVERAVPISSNIANAFIDFSKMNASIVAVKTDVIRNGKPVVGYGFNSNGRYAPSGFADGHTVEGGFVTLPDAPGVGFEAKEKLYDLLKTL